MRETHIDFIDRWAAFVRENPTKWKKIHTAFIDAQFHKHREIVGRLLQQPGGREKLQELYGGRVRFLQ